MKRAISIDNRDSAREDVTIVMVTSESGERLNEVEKTSLTLAVAQWIGSRRATAEAREALRSLGLDEDEIECRRRATSGDRRIESLLRYGVTLAITRGRVESTDVQRIKPAPTTELLMDVAITTAQTILNVALIESLNLSSPYPAIDMSIGDY